MNLEELDRILAENKRVREEREKLDIEGLKRLRRRFKTICNNAKREELKHRQEKSLKVIGKTRYGITPTKEKTIDEEVICIDIDIDDPKAETNDENIESTRRSVRKRKQVDRYSS